MAYRHDAFLSHNTRDKTHVRQIAEYLNRHQVSVYLDERELQAGDRLDAVLTEALVGSRVAFLFIGPNNIGPFQSREIQAAFFQQADSQQLRLVPVFLPGTSSVQKDDFISQIGEILFLSFTGHTVFEPKVLDALVNAARGELSRSDAGQASLPAVPAAAAAGGEDVIIDQMCRQLDSKGLLCVLGWTWSHRGTDGLPDPGSTAAHLLRRLAKRPASAENSPDSLDQAAFAVFVKSNLDFIGLERSALNDFIWPRTIEVDVVHRELASLFDTLNRRASARGGSEAHDPHLILTTAPDIRLERALMMAGVSFTRAVVSWKEPTPDIQWRSYQISRDPRGLVACASSDGSVTRERQIEEISDAQQKHLHAELGRAHTLIQSTGGTRKLPPLNELVRHFQHEEILQRSGVRIPAVGSALELPRPIIVKLHGSIDTPESWCALPEQLTSFHKLNLPPFIKSAIAENVAIVLGFGPSEHQFLQLHAAILSDPFCAGNRRGPKRVMVAPLPNEDFDPQAALDRALQDLIRAKAERLFGLEFSEREPAPFVAALRQQVELAARTSWS